MFQDARRTLTAAGAALLVIGIGACGSASPSTTIQGEVNRFEVGVGAQPSMVQVSLEETELGGLRSVSVYFDPEDLACDDGSPLDVDELRPGQHIEFAIDDDVPTPEFEGPSADRSPAPSGDVSFAWTATPKQHMPLHAARRSREHRPTPNVVCSLATA